MNTARIRLPTHRPLKILPWYVNCTLDPREATKVAAHVRGCPICQREVEDLARLFSSRAKSLPKRPVEEARLDQLFARIDRYEMDRRREARTERRSLRDIVNTSLFGWLIARPAWTGAFAALILAVIAIPMLNQRTVERPYEVLSSENGVTEQLRVRIRFTGTATQEDVERLVRASLAQQQLTNPYRIERRGNGEYVVIFAQKPGVAEMSRLLEDVRESANVADVVIDGE
jgi:anti-sigma factor RsiW